MATDWVLSAQGLDYVAACMNYNMQIPVRFPIDQVHQSMGLPHCQYTTGVHLN
jgi:hypothetical protein